MDEMAFYQAVQRHAGLVSLEEAIQATHDTLASLRDVLGRRARRELQAQLPPRLAVELEGGPQEPDQLIDKEVFVGRVMSNLPTEALWDQTLGGLDLVSDSMGDEAGRRTQAVFAVLKQVVRPDTQEAIRSALPADVAGWFDRAGQGL